MTTSHNRRCLITLYLYEEDLIKYEVGGGGLNHNLQHDPSAKPTHSPTATTVTVRPSIYQVLVGHG
jgi:hypothetical protein